MTDAKFVVGGRYLAYRINDGTTMSVQEENVEEISPSGEYIKMKYRTFEPTKDWVIVETLLKEPVK